QAPRREPLPGQAPTPDPAAPRDQAIPLESSSSDRLSRLFGYHLRHVAVVPNSSAVTGTTKAITKDDKVHFRPGTYQPWTPEGDWLIAHELAHVAQQCGEHGERTATRKELEREADRAAHLVARGHTASIRLRADRTAAYAFDEGDAHEPDVDEAQLDKK